MQSRTRGIHDRPVVARPSKAVAFEPRSLAPIAVFDFETTGLNPGDERVIEVSVIRIDPGRPPRQVLHTLVNPRRRQRLRHGGRLARQLDGATTTTRSGRKLRP